MAKPTDTIEILIDGSSGQFVPQRFVNEMDLSKFEGIDETDIESCQDPECEWYWDAWDQILSNAIYRENGEVWRLHQDGDLFLVNDDRMTEEEKAEFYGPE